MRTKLIALALSVVFAMAGCANTTQQHFDPDTAKSLSSKALPANPDRAVVYLMREWALGQSFLPPVYFAVDGVMVSAMPLGAYVPLSLEPGSHVVTRFSVTGGGALPIKVDQLDVQLTASAGSTNYVSEVNAFSNTFRAVDAARGQSILKDAALAKFYYAPVTVSVFKSRLAAAERDRVIAVRANQAPSPTTASAPPRDYVSSSAQTSAAFESMASLALTVLGIVAEGVEETHDRRAAPPNWQPSAAAARTAATTAIRREEPTPKRASVLPIDVESRGSERIYRDYQSGNRYVVNGDRIAGSDGSRGRIVGSTLYFDSGQSYQRAGNTLTGSDGRSCQLIGDMLYCK